jgi:uncharacterized membrane protein YccC
MVGTISVLAFAKYIYGITKSGRMRWAGHVAHSGGRRMLRKI